MIEILLDGKLVQLLGPLLPLSPTPLSAGEGEHLLEIRRRSEPLVGPTRFLGIELSGSATILPPPVAPPYLLFLGDSITCGYGNLAPDATHPFRPETEDVFRAYAGLACQELSTGFQACAWSGKGLQRNFDRDGSPTIPEIWRRTSPLDAASHHTNPPRPLLAVINLGSNDVYHDDPDWQAFERDMTDLGQAVRLAFPGLPLVLLDGPLLSDASLRAPDGSFRPVLTRLRTALDHARDRLQPTGPTWRFSLTPCSPDEPRGADAHPSQERHRVAGAELATFLRPLLPSP
jgi:lysophospholipase L1-like esterase